MMSTSQTSTLIITLLAALAGGCGDEPSSEEELRCEDETRGDVYSPGLLKQGRDGVFQVTLMEASPLPPSSGTSTWVIEVSDIASGTPIENAEVSATTYMPDHGHSGPTPTVSSLPDPGQFTLDAFDLWMPGLWEVRIGVADETRSDLVTVIFCIEG